MQKINNFSRWVQLADGQRIDFNSEKARIVRLDVNAPSEVCLYIVNEDEEAFFLALVKGRDTIEFHSEGRFGLTVDGGVVNLYTVDGDDTSIKVLAPVIFTKIAERRRRNPELEAMVATMERNLNRRMEAQAGEIARLLHHRQTTESALRAASRVPASAGTESTQNDNPSTSGASAAGTDNGANPNGERDGGTDRPDPS